MQICLLKGKIHGARVTECDLHYEGSIAIDRDLMEAANLRPFEQVDVLNITTGARITTYVIEAARGSGTIGLNGAAARTAMVGDEVIILAYAWLKEQEAESHAPAIVIVDADNRAR